MFTGALQDIATLLGITRSRCDKWISMCTRCESRSAERLALKSGGLMLDESGSLLLN
jgi:hypothetical protein